MYLNVSCSPTGSINLRFTAQNWSNLSKTKECDDFQFLLKLLSTLYEPLTRPSQSWVWSFFCIADIICPRCLRKSASFRELRNCASTISLLGHLKTSSPGALLKCIVTIHGNVLSSWVYKSNKIPAKKEMNENLFIQSLVR